MLRLDADPATSREHILVATILDRAWRANRDLDLGALVQLIQTPGIERVGVIDLESFFPARARASLAMSLNNMLASPSLGAWLDGEPTLRVCYTPRPANHASRCSRSLTSVMPSA